MKACENVEPDFSSGSTLVSAYPALLSRSQSELLFYALKPMCVIVKRLSPETKFEGNGGGTQISFVTIRWTHFLVGSCYLSMAMSIALFLMSTI